MTDKEVERLIEQRAEKYAANVPNAENVADVPNVPKVPELLYFSGVVKDAKKRIARRQNIQFAIFIVVAVIVAAPMMLCFFASIAVYAAVQLLLIVLFAVLRLYAHHTEATR